MGRKCPVGESEACQAAQQCLFVLELGQIRAALLQVGVAMIAISESLPIQVMLNQPIERIGP